MERAYSNGADVAEPSKESLIREVERELRIREARVRRAAGVESALRTLKRNGADDSKVVKLLVYSTLDQDAFVQGDDGVRRQRARLRRLSKLLRDVAHELEIVFTDPSTFPAAFLARWSSEDPGRSVSDLTPSFEARIGTAERAISLIEHCARVAIQDERGLAAVARALERWSGTDANMIALIEHVYATTGDFYDGLLADLLQASHDALRPGSGREFTEESLRKFRQRHPSTTGWLVKKKLTSKRTKQN
jgi:hypothetical protein